MSDQVYNILLVDDDPFLLELHTAFLESKGWITTAAENGMQALELLKQTPEVFDIVVTDVSMPQMDGYELCKQVRACQECNNIPVIFVSALTDLEEKLKGYSVGGEDYIIKPVLEEELYEKIKTQLDIRWKYKDLNKRVSESQNMAFEAMTFSSELGQVVECYKHMFEAKGYEEMAQILFGLTASFNLECTIQIYAPNRVYNLTDKGEVSPLEINVIELARKKSRFYDFGSKTVINFSTFSLLLKNMPVDQPEKYGRLKDVFGMICNGVETKVQQLNNDVLLQKRDEIIKSIQTALNNIEHAFSEVQKENITAIEDMIQDLDGAVMILQLSDNQESEILDIANKCLSETNKSFYKGLKIREELENIQRQFSTALDFNASKGRLRIAK